MIALSKKTHSRALKLMVKHLDQHRISIMEDVLNDLDSEDSTNSKRLVVNQKNIDNMICFLEGVFIRVIFTVHAPRLQVFINAVDCAVVNYSASTRFTDLGLLNRVAHFAISRDKLQYRRPVRLGH